MNAIIIERGNGFPNVGDFCSDSNGDLYVITQMSMAIQTSGRGDGNWLRAQVEEADWDDCEESDVHTAKVELV